MDDGETLWFLIVTGRLQTTHATLRVYGVDASHSPSFDYFTASPAAHCRCVSYLYVNLRVICTGVWGLVLENRYTDVFPSPIWWPWPTQPAIPPGSVKWVRRWRPTAAWLAMSVAGCWVTHCAGLCVQAVGGDLKTSWRLSFSDEKRVRGDYTRNALYKSTSYLTFIWKAPVLDCFKSCPRNVRQQDEKIPSCTQKMTTGRVFSRIWRWLVNFSAA